MLKHLFVQTKQKKLILLSILTLALSACGQKEVTRKPPAPAVSVYQLESQKVGSYREFVARTEAFKEASLRARVEGELLEKNFKEGTVVDKGQVLLKIDPTAYNTALASAKAALNSTLSAEDNAVRNLKRATELIGDGYISQSDFDNIKSKKQDSNLIIVKANPICETIQ